MSVVHWLKNVFQSKKGARGQAPQLKEIKQQLVFVKSDPLTLGVEFELALLDKVKLKLAHDAPEIIAEANQPTIKKEQYMHMVEVTTLVCKNTHEAEEQ